jgi:hypothetical protein
MGAGHGGDRRWARKGRIDGPFSRISLQVPGNPAGLPGHDPRSRKPVRHTRRRRHPGPGASVPGMNAEWVRRGSGPLVLWAAYLTKTHKDQTELVYHGTE